MTASSKSQAFKLVFAHEGGFVNNPKDPGGATNMGVTQAVYDSWRKRAGKPVQSVRSITKAEATAIYEAQYWTKIDGDDLPAGLDYAVYDYAVNSGPARAVKDLQRTLAARGRSVGVDGILGNTTMVAVCAEMAKDEEGLITDLCARRLAFMKSLSTWRTFGAGWQRRVEGRDMGPQDSDDGVVDFAVKMAKEDKAYGKDGQVKAITAAELPSSIGSYQDETSGKANEGDQAVTKTPIGKIGTVTAGLAGVQQFSGDAVDKLAPLQDNEHVAGIIHALIAAGVVVGILIMILAYRHKLSERAAA